MKIVVSYWSGSEYSGGEVVKCIEADSCGEVYCKLEEAINNYINNVEDFCKNKVGKICPSEEIKLFNTIFDAPDMIYNVDKFLAPDIHDLNEWFELNKDN